MVVNHGLHDQDRGGGVMVAGVGVGTAADVMTCHYVDDDAVVITMHGIGRVRVPLGRARKCWGLGCSPGHWMRWGSSPSP